VALRCGPSSATPTRSGPRSPRPANVTGRLEVVAGQLADTTALEPALSGVDAAFVALGVQGRLQRLTVETAVRAGLPHLVRLSVLNAGHESLGLNQRAHADIDDAVARAELPYTSLRPATFSRLVLDLVDQIRETAGWSGTAPHGRNAFIDPRDVKAI
jgi:uncharacterized protein YbjT (DUF2867 family)